MGNAQKVSQCWCEPCFCRHSSVSPAAEITVLFSGIVQPEPLSRGLSVPEPCGASVGSLL